MHGPAISLALNIAGHRISIRLKLEGNLEAPVVDRNLEGELVAFHPALFDRPLVAGVSTGRSSNGSSLLF